MEVLFAPGFPRDLDSTDVDLARSVANDLGVALAEMLQQPVDIEIVDALPDCREQVGSMMFRILTHGVSSLVTAQTACDKINQRAGYAAASLRPGHTDVIWLVKG